MEPFDPIKAEKNELDTLTEQGMKFTVPCRSLLGKLQGKTQRTFVIKQPYLGTLDYLSAEFIRMDFSAERLQADGYDESKRLMAINARRCARVVAISMLNRKLTIRLFTRLLTEYLMWHVTPAKLVQLAMMISKLSNMVDFITSIRLMSISRTTTPTLVEEKNQEQKTATSPSETHPGQDLVAEPIQAGV